MKFPSRQFFRSVLHKTYITYFVVGLLISILLPADLRVPELFSEITQIIPSINKYASVSSYPNVTIWMRVILWLLMPILITNLFLGYIPEKPIYWTEESLNLNLIKEISFILFAIFFISVFLFFFIFMPIDLEKNISSDRISRGIAFVKFISTNRIGLGLCTSFDLAAVSIAISMLFMYVTVFMIVVKKFSRNYKIISKG